MPRRTGIRKNDAYDLYLAYHEGSGGYLHHSYVNKPWLIRAARDVAAVANNYNAQLARCECNLPKKPWWRVW
jgi:hypothetical protein